MKASLVSREVVADSIELVTRGHLFDAVVALSGCDKTIPGTVMALARDLGKRPVIAPNGDGFIGNRLFDRFHQEAMYLVEEGAWPEEVDCALEDWGMTIGPFRALDMVGNDIPWGVRRQRALRDTSPPQPRIGDALCEAGWHGRKAGRGWYLYDRATPRGRPYEDLLALIRRESRALGRVRRRIGADEIVARCLTALMVEAMALLAEGRAARASDIDVVYVTGYGFPAALGGPMYLADITEAVAQFGPVFVQIYGQGECPMGITALSRDLVADRSHPRWRERLLSVGRAQSPVEVRIGDADGNPVGPGEHGEIMVKGDIVMPGYWQNPEANAKTLVDGWLMTGDMGFMDEDGFVTMQDRSKDMIITGGYNVYPREVEDVLMAHPAVMLCAVVAMPDEKWGEVPCAFVELKDGKQVTEEALIAYARNHLAGFKTPKAVRFGELPKTPTGKIQKFQLRRSLREG